MDQKILDKYDGKLPTKKWCEWACKATGKPESEFWLQGIFLLTEGENFTQEEAEEIMRYHWER
jgi:hypothetical protein